MLGMGPLEILIILLVAFVVLGPQKMVDAGRMLGKATRELRRFTEELPKLTLDDENIDSSDRPSAPIVREASARPNGDERTVPDDDAPVSFQRPRTSKEQGETDKPGEQGLS